MRAILITILVLCFSLNGEVLEFKPLLNLLKKTDKKSYNKALEIQKLTESSLRKNGDIIYCLISDSIDIKYFKNIIFEVTALRINTSTQVAFILQGIYTKDFIKKMEKLNLELEKYEYGDMFKENVNLFISPSLFTKYKIKKVPALMYGEYSGSIYPQNNKISYLVRGEVSLLQFFKLISTKESRFEAYSNIISTLY